MISRFKLPLTRTAEHAAMFGLAVIAGVGLSLFLGGAWWCSQDCSQIGWLLIIGPFAAAAGVFAYGISFFLANWLGRWISTFSQILISGFLPGLLIFLYYVPYMAPNLGLDHAGRSAGWAFWHVFGPIIIGGLISIPGGLVGGLLLFVVGDGRKRHDKTRIP
jgi:hypothetical protein